MPTLKYAISYYFRSLKEVTIERIHLAVYMRKLRFTIKTADLMHQATKGRKYYVMHDLFGEPTIVTASTVNDLKAKGRIPKDWTHIDLEQKSLYIPFQLKPGDLTKPKVMRKWRDKKAKILKDETQGH